MYNCTNNIAQKRPFVHFVTHNGTIVKISVNNEINEFRQEKIQRLLLLLYYTIIDGGIVVPWCQPRGSKPTNLNSRSSTFSDPPPLHPRQTYRHLPLTATTAFAMTGFQVFPRHQALKSPVLICSTGNQKKSPFILPWNDKFDGKYDLWIKTAIKV